MLANTKDALVELEELAGTLEAFSVKASDRKLTKYLDELQERAGTVGKSWSGSWIGYHAHVYYADLSVPPPGAHFSSEWGLQDAYDMGTRGQWVQCDPAAVQTRIQTGVADQTKLAESLTVEASQLIDASRAELISILDVLAVTPEPPSMVTLRKEVLGCVAMTRKDVVASTQPSGQFMTRDAVALSQGFWTPPHVQVLAEVFSVRITLQAVASLAKLSRRAAAHYARSGRTKVDQGTTKRDANMNPSSVFIVHGHDDAAKFEVARFLEKLGCAVTILHEQPSGGRTVIEKLERNAEVAFVVVLLTPDDLGRAKAEATEMPRARQNVIMELGYFIGRLGRERVCALVRDDVEKPSDYAGVVWVPLDSGAWKMTLMQEMKGAGVEFNAAAAFA